MLQAILSGKSGRIPEGVTPGSSWSHALKRSEDLLTSTVFERLAYLDAPLLWAILAETFGPPLPNFRVAELLNVEFWPTWADPTKDNAGTVEPDVFMEFHLGDPPQRVAVICEAKLGQLHYATQWQRQWMAYKRQVELGEASSDKVFLLAIGGLKGHRAQMVERFHDEIITETLGEVSINAVAADWSRLADAIDKALSDASNGSKRILTDIAEALALFGYRHLQTLSNLPALDAMRDPVSSLNTVMKMGFKND